MVKKRSQPVLRVGKVEDGDPDFAAFCAAFKLDPAKRTFDLTAEKLDPFLAGAPPGGLDAIDLETRSLSQVLFFVAHGVEVPAADALSGAAPLTLDADGGVFDWDRVVGGLFKVRCCAGKHPPECSRVAVCYRGHWFYVDRADRDTVATFHLLVELSRLEVGAKAGAAPLLTLPLGGGQ